jgi:riboflavin kinase, archaea type
MVDEEGESCMVPDIIFYLLQRNAHREPKKITTGEIAEGIGVSQQTASRKLISLEREGAVERVGGKIMLTKKAVDRVREFVADVLESLKGVSMSFGGSVTVGLGKGAYFVSQKEYMAAFQKKLGFKPYAGTLNVKIDDEDIEKRITLREQVPIEIPGFRKGGKTFGKIACYKCVVNGAAGAIVFPENSQHGLSVIEVVSPFQLRKKLTLSDGSRVTIELV